MEKLIPINRLNISPNAIIRILNPVSIVLPSLQTISLRDRVPQFFLQSRRFPALRFIFRIGMCALPLHLSDLGDACGNRTMPG
jgi:hypothetical protein